ncbi:polysaccharide biosynthesis/export family protein [Methylobacterium sp. NEAU K]|uniref:polysaccharide biosynthesis/export family protein n=1 Tax=Methylobacterium sp. NEAU K TaxID=3064946 RepID=UPI0027345B04|nr:polysaccharide biosynthesis/export family protein [Methylobacterium sp. NEAU K]MDP4004399.1 polysaccharide biosynthesis/export family protein [Methylobacterium sp. NEAU K]
MYLRQIAASCVLVVASILAASAAEISGRYLLGPQDHLTIRVYDLRRNTGEAYSWTALNGEFTVAADGTVSLPLIGQIKAAGGTPFDLAGAIGNALKLAADLAETPAASVEVAKYRPYYITGAVQQPGKYEYQPGLTVLQAVSTAQGLLRSTDPRLVRREVVTSRGELRTLAAERIALAAKQARLDAEIAGADAIAFGEDLKGAADKARAEQAMRGEQLLFETRRNSVKAEVSAIEQSMNSFRGEMSALENKSKTLDRQLELSRGELNLVNDLVAKGLTITPRKLAAEQSQASFESSRLDVQVAMLRAQQSLTRAERDIIELRARFRREALTEAAETRLKLNQNDEKARTTERLVADAESQMLGNGDDMSEMLVPRYEITRRTGESSSTSLAQEDVRVEPGDVVRVTLLRQQAGKTGEATPPTAQRRPSDGVSSSRSGPATQDGVRRAAESADR